MQKSFASMLLSHRGFCNRSITATLSWGYGQVRWTVYKTELIRVQEEQEELGAQYSMSCLLAGAGRKKQNKKQNNTGKNTKRYLLCSYSVIWCCSQNGDGLIISLFAHFVWSVLAAPEDTEDAPVEGLNEWRKGREDVPPVPVLAVKLFSICLLKGSINPFFLNIAAKYCVKLGIVRLSEQITAAKDQEH